MVGRNNQVSVTSEADFMRPRVGFPNLEKWTRSIAVVG